MEQRLSFITLAVDDVAAVRAFYVDGLRWEPVFEVPGSVLMIPVGESLVLSLWARAEFEEEVGPVRRGDGVVPMTLAHNVRSREQVDEVLATAGAAGAVVHPGQDRAWGGYSGYFADPAGFHWEVAWNPGELGELVLPSAS